MRAPTLRLFEDELVIDFFAGGGGTSEGIKQALGRDPDIAVNHDADALSMHAANHPGTLHLCEDVFAVDPKRTCKGRPVGLFWLSPDCKHHSKAKGGKPVDKKIRGLAWVAARWAQEVKPRVIMLENVEEFADWGPLGADNKPDKIRKGLTFRRFVGRLRNLGYDVDWRELRACDYGAPTTRKRLFLVARCDGRAIVWPEPTHSDGGRDGLLPWRSAAECIDWSLPCPSIFLSQKVARALGVKRPLADNTLRRIARGIKRFVIDAAEPFIVPITHTGDSRVHSIREPLRTVTGARRGELSLVVPSLIQTGYGERDGQAPRSLDLHKPLGTVVAGGSKHALVGAFLAKHYSDQGQRPGSALVEPISTITASDHNSLVASSLVKLKGTCRDGQSVTEPLHTIQASGNHYAEVRAFLIKFYSEGGQWQAPAGPMHTIPTKARIGLVMVRGEPHVIVDIGMRMLQPPELFMAQGFPPAYIIDRGHDGRKFTKETQVRMCGNSVSPFQSCAMVLAQFTDYGERAVA